MKGNDFQHCFSPWQKTLRDELEQLRALRAKESEASLNEAGRLTRETQKELAAYKEQINQHSVTICAMEERLNKVMKKNKELNNEVSNLKQQNQREYTKHRRQTCHARIFQPGLRLAIAQTDARSVMPISFR